MSAPATALFTVEVDYDLTLAEAIERGHYDWVNSNYIASWSDDCFPAIQSGKATLQIELVPLGITKIWGLHAAVVLLDALKARGLRQAELRELLALGETFPELQREFTIMALLRSWGRSDVHFSVAGLSEEEDGVNSTCTLTNKGGAGTLSLPFASRWAI